MVGFILAGGKVSGGGKFRAADLFHRFDGVGVDLAVADDLAEDLLFAPDGLGRSGDGDIVVMGDAGHSACVYTIDQTFGDAVGVFADKVLHCLAVVGDTVGVDAASVLQPDGVGRAHRREHQHPAAQSGPHERKVYQQLGNVNSDQGVAPGRRIGWHRRLACRLRPHPFRVLCEGWDKIL